MATLKDFLEIMEEPEVIKDPEAMKKILNIIKSHLSSKRPTRGDSKKPQKTNTFIDRYGLKKGDRIFSFYSRVTREWKSINQITNEGIIAYNKPYKKPTALRTCQRSLDDGVNKGWFKKKGSGRKSKYRLVGTSGLI